MTLALAAHGGVAALLALLIACSSASSSVGADAGPGADSDSGSGTAPDSGSGTSADGASEGSSVSCTANGYDCTPLLTVCCGGGTCAAAAGGGFTCAGGDSGAPGCLTKGEPCSTIECCNGQGSCGEGTTNTCP